MFDYKCHVRQINSENRQETHFTHEGELFFDYNGKLDYSYNTNKEEEVKLILLSKASLQKPQNEILIYKDNALKVIRKKAHSITDPEKSKEKEKQYELKRSKDPERKSKKKQYETKRELNP